MERYARFEEHSIISRRAKRTELRELKLRYKSMNSGDGSKVRKIYESLGNKKNVAEFDRIKEELRKRIDALEKELE